VGARIPGDDARLHLKNTFKDIESIVSDLGAGGTRFEFECYDVGHLYNLAFLLEKGIVEPPLLCRRSSVSSAASGPTRRTCCT
jgi:uncharacterized protein (DUF849 family)